MILSSFDAKKDRSYFSENTLMTFRNHQVMGSVIKEYSATPFEKRHRVYDQPHCITKVTIFACPAQKLNTAYREDI